MPPPFSSFPSTPIAQLLGSNGPIHAVTYSSPPSPYILTGSSDRLIRLYNPTPSPPITHHSNTITTTHPPSQTSPIPPGRLITTFPPLHSHPILSLAISPSNATFLSSGGDRTLFLWDVATSLSTRRFHGHAGRVNAVAFAGGGGDALALSGGLDGTVRIWDLRSASTKAVQVLTEARDAVTSVVAPSGGWEVVAGSVDGRVRGYDVRMGRCVVDVVGASVTSLCLDGEGGGETVLVGGLDSKVRMMDRRDGRCLRVYEGEGWRNEGVRVQSCFGGAGRWVVAGDEFPVDEEGGEGRVWAWDVMTGRVVARLGVPWGPGRRMGVGADGREKGRRNVVSCVAWKDGGRGDQFCVGGRRGWSRFLGGDRREARQDD
ncbi:WD40-repeat-containing domain protein [Schizothecium vesticola]|uniref:WD40-repeat-containing domain protein n=1 Tax=Schizothecium vesticola TaxID=314040 RepID=A0AA40F6U1_9PEZI|nr:WD40-repeat-containing domain protein [Schizothecium vesticola]